MKIVFYEIQKICKKKNFIIIAAVFLIANLMLLWYVDSLRNLPSASAYREVQAQLQTMEEDQKGVFLSEKYHQAQAYSLMQEIESIKGMQDLSEERRQEMIDMTIGENQELITNFSDSCQADLKPQYTNTFETEAAFWQGLYQEWQVVSGYPAQLEQIEKDAKLLTLISIFRSDGANSFSSRNILKTAGDYQKMQGLKVPYAVTEGVSFPLRSKTTDALAACVSFFIALVLITEEKQRGLFGILRITKKGRLALIMGKIIALVVVSAASTAVLYGTNLIYGALRYGLPSLTLSLQAVNGFINSALHVDIGCFLLLFILMKWLGCFAFTTIIIFVTIHIKTAVSGFLCCGLIYGAGIALTELIPPQSVWNILRYINPVGILDTGGILGTYYNLNLAGYPCGIQNVVLIFMVCLAALFASLSGISFLIRRNWDTAEFFLVPLWRKIKGKRCGATGSMLRHELYKLFALNKVAVILVLFCVTVATLFPSLIPGITLEQQRIRNYSANLQGGVTEETLAFLDQEEQRIQQAHEKTDWIMEQVAQGVISPQAASELSVEYQGILNREEAFRYVQERVGYVQKHPGTKVLFEDGYLQLIHHSGSDTIVIMIVATLILCFSGFFAMEYKTGVISILSITPGGRCRTVKAKLICACIVCTVIFIAAVLPAVVTVGSTYGLGGWGYPLGSIPAFEGQSIPIVFYLLIHYLVQFLSVLAISMFILFLSYRLRKTTTTVSASAAILLVPMVLKTMRVPFSQYFSVSQLYNFASGVTSMSGKIALILLLLILLIVSIWFLTDVMMHFGTSKTNCSRIKLSFGKEKDARI